MHDTHGTTEARFAQALIMRKSFDDSGIVIVSRNDTLIISLHDRLIARLIEGDLLYVTFANQRNEATRSYLNIVLEILTKHWRASIIKGAGTFVNKLHDVRVVGSVYINPTTGRKLTPNKPMPTELIKELDTSN